jgi:hypothetical protein
MKQKTDLWDKGIEVKTDNNIAFYSVYNNIVTLDVVYDYYHNEIKEGEAYQYFKNREVQLTKKYSRYYCPSHSNFMENRTCNICGYKI